MGKQTRNMLLEATLVVSIIAVLLIPYSYGTGNSHRIKIHIPHSIHHHTHTKFVPVPANNTGVQPGLFANTPFGPGAPGIPGQPGVPGQFPPFGPGAPGQPGVPGQFPPGTIPVFGQPGVNGLPQPGAFPPGFQQQPAFPGQLPGQIPPGFPQPVPPGFPQPGFPPFGANAMYVNGDYEYIDMVGGKNNKDKMGRADEQKPQKIKNFINIQENKERPIMELLDIGQMYNQDGPNRIKVDVTSDKAYIRHKKPRKVTKGQSPKYKTRGSSYYDIDRSEYNPETASYELPSEDEETEAVSQQQQWLRLQDLVENEIQERFPGLNLKTEMVTASPEGENTNTEESEDQDDIGDKRPVGYILFERE